MSKDKVILDINQTIKKITQHLHFTKFYRNKLNNTSYIGQFSPDSLKEAFFQQLKSM